jgi:hypothetical protein
VVEAASNDDPEGGVQEKLNIPAIEIELKKITTGKKKCENYLSRLLQKVLGRCRSRGQTNRLGAG